VEHNTKYNCFGLGDEDYLRKGRSSCFCNSSIEEDTRPVLYIGNDQLYMSRIESVGEETSVTTTRGLDRDSSQDGYRSPYHEAFVSTQNLETMLSKAPLSHFAEMTISTIDREPSKSITFNHIHANSYVEQ
jgi:hypothetical protein